MPINLANPAAAQDALTIIENGPLPRGDGALRSVKDDSRMRGIQRRDGGFGRDVLMAGLPRCPHRFAGRLVRDPVNVLHFPCRWAPRFIISDHHEIILPPTGDSTKRRSGPPSP